MSCKDCECHENLKSRGLGTNGDYRDKGHWCEYKIEVQYSHGGKGLYSNHKPMTYKEYVKTPDWCPKKLKTYKVEGINLPVINVISGIY